MNRIFRLSMGLLMVFACCSTLCVVSYSQPAKRNVYIDSDGLLKALDAIGISATYDGDIVLGPNSGLTTAGSVEGLALAVRGGSAISDFRGNERDGRGSYSQRRYSRADSYQSTNDAARQWLAIVSGHRHRNLKIEMNVSTLSFSCRGVPLPVFALITSPRLNAAA